MSPEQSQLLSEHNRIRAEHGLSPLLPHAALLAASQDHSRFMATAEAKVGALRALSHDTNGGMSGRAARHGWSGTYLAENIAFGSQSAAAVCRQWMDSAGHRRNILAAAPTHAGFGCSVASSGQWYWVAMFGIPGEATTTTTTRGGFWRRLLGAMFGVREIA